LALASRPILLTMKNEERSLMPLVVISRQNTLVKEQEGGYAIVDKLTYLW